MFACITLAIVLGVLATPPAYVGRGPFRRTYVSPASTYYNTVGKQPGSVHGKRLLGVQNIPMRIVFIALLLLAATAASLAARDPYADVDAMRQAFSHIRTAKAVENFSKGPHQVTVYYVAPDRYRIVLPDSEIIFIGQTEYGKKTGGPWGVMPGAASSSVVVHHLWEIAGDPTIDLHKLFVVSAAGTKRIDGVATREYRLRSIPGGSQETIWIGTGNLPVAAELNTGTESKVNVRYQNYNAPIAVVAPMSPSPSAPPTIQPATTAPSPTP